MDSSKVEVKKEIKKENIESFNVSIKSETKSNFKLDVRKERKDNLSLQIGLDIIERLDLPVKKQEKADGNKGTSHWLDLDVHSANFVCLFKRKW